MPWSSCTYTPKAYLLTRKGLLFCQYAARRRIDRGYWDSGRRMMRALSAGHRRLSAKPPITRPAADSFQAGIASASNRADALMPKIGTSRAMGVTVAAG